MYVCGVVCTKECMYVYIYIYISIYKHIHMYIYIYMHIHTYTSLLQAYTMAPESTV